MALAGLAQAALAQVPDDVREQLARGGVATSRGQVYASASGPLRGTRESSEELYATRAMRVLAMSLCGFEPAPGRSLEAGISGFTLVSAILRGREVEVVMRAPVQKPVCRVIPAAVVPAAPLAPAGDAATRLLEPGYTRSKDMTVRIFGGEY